MSTEIKAAAGGNRLQQTKSTYGHLLTGALKSFVEQQLEKPPESQNEIQEELAILRAATAHKVDLFSKALERGVNEEIIGWGEILKKELKQVADMAFTAARIQATNSDQITKQAMEVIVGSLIDIIFEELRLEKNGLQIASRIEKRVLANVTISADRGTVSLPSDEMVALMDNTIPQADE